VERHYVYLIPGFFGFADLGGISYFHHIRETLTELFHAQGVDIEVHFVDTLPTASLRKRALALHDQIAETALDEDAPIHLIGHSTGGLDARLFTTPSAMLFGGVDPETYAARVRTIVTVATPHFGTPMASFFDSLLGQNLLLLLSMATIYAMRFGRFPLSTLFSIVGVITRLDDVLGFRHTIVDQFYDNLFSNLDGTHADSVQEYLDAIREDRTLLGQLTPGGIDLLNAAAEDRPGVRYGSVLTQARPPQLETMRRIGADPYRLASHALYACLHTITAQVPTYPEPTRAQREAIRRGFGGAPARGANDGVVPTWSQLHGEVIHCTWADHLDVCGHFDEHTHQPPHIDWLCSGTGHRRAAFNTLWREVTRFVLN